MYVWEHSSETLLYVGLMHILGVSVAIEIRCRTEKTTTDKFTRR